jgi:hypothetical protein
MKYHLTPVRMNNIKKTKLTNADKDVEKGELYPLLVGCNLIQPLWKTV